MKIIYFLLSICLLCIGCNSYRGASVIKNYSNKKVFFSQKENTTSEVSVAYIGCGGYMISYQNEVLLLDPFFSNITIKKLLNKHFSSDTTLINAYFAKKMPASSANISLLLSHSHYDHLADFPYLLSQTFKARTLDIYANHSAKNILQSYHLPYFEKNNFVDIEKKFGTFYATSPDKHTENLSVFEKIKTKSQKIIITPIPSEHAGHFNFFGGRKIPYLSGEVDTFSTKKLDGAIDFKEGNNFNFMIDFVDNQGVIQFRIFANNGAGCNEGVGFPPKKLLEEKAVDLLLICGANYNTVKNYPFGLIQNTNPSYIFLNHWENFFVPIPKLLQKPQTVPNTNIVKLIKKIQAKTTAPIIVKQPLSDEVKFGF